MDFQFDAALFFQGGSVLTGQELNLRQTAPDLYEGRTEAVRVRLETGSRILLSVENHSRLALEKAQWRMTCSGKNISHCRVPLPCTVRDSGIIDLQQAKASPASTMFTGLFYGSDKPCLLLGTQLPQNNIHNYQVSALSDDTVEITGTTEYTVGQSVMETLCTETALVIYGSSPLEAMQQYADHLPDLPAGQLPAPMVGWNSWDYYFTTVSSEAVEENLEVIRRDPLLRERLKCAVIDDGWETCVGEWYTNHRFPEGLQGLADRIRSCGLIPGIWTNGAQARDLSYPTLRQPELFIKDEFGIPQTADGMAILDPTHPETEKFVLETYSRLYEAGFRIFKVDFLSTILQGKRFHDPVCGPYEAVRRLLRLIRKAVGPDSHIVGCSYPAECGPGIVDSSRISVDIHNHWLHVLWIMEYMQTRFWCNGKLFRSDPDMLVVRGSDTSLEEETNVFNPWNLVPPGKDRFSSRWRRGPVFNYAEAETWANLVVFSGGDIMLGDRLSMLNKKGMGLVHSHLTPHSHAAVPLDLGDKEVSEFWYDSQTRSLLMVNTADCMEEMEFSFPAFGLAVPDAVSCGKPFTYQNGILCVALRAHESAVICW